MIKKRMYFVLGIAALLILSYFIPTIVMSMEDYSLKKEVRRRTMETVELNSGAGDFYAELQNFPSMLSQNYLYVGDGKKMTVDQVREVELDFLQKLSIELEYDNLKHAEEHPCLFTDTKQETACFVWECHLINNDKESYSLWIDDASGNVLGFYLSQDFEQTDETSILQATQTDVDSIAEVMAEYYGFATAQADYNKNEGVYSVRFYDEDGVEQLALPLEIENDIVVFNITEVPLYSDGSIGKSALVDKKNK